jgi:hypothetical protein
MNQSQSKLDQQLKEFRKKYYTDKILRGVLILALLISSMLFIALLSEGLFGFSSGARKTIVVGLGIIFIGTLGFMIAWPLAQLFNISRGISDFQIADIVKQSFPNINDKLLNLLQLRQSHQNNQLALAAVDQKAADIAPVPISKAINLNVNRKYLYLLLIPLLLYGATYLTDRDLLSNGANHLINYNEEFVPPAAFSVIIPDAPTELVAGQDYEVNIEVEGKELPKELYIYIKKGSETQFLDYSTDKKSNTSFSYNLTDLKEDFSFYVTNPDFERVDYNRYDIKVLKRPYIKKFQVRINYPGYTGLQSEVLEDNIGDFKAIKGSWISWEMEPQGDIEGAFFVDDQKKDPKPFESKGEEGSFVHKKRLMENLDYFISLNSVDGIPNIDTVKYRADVVLDRYPSVYVFSPNSDFLVDLDPSMPLELEIADDFGFTKMALYYRFTKSGGTSEVTPDFKEYPLKIERKTLLQPLNYLVDLTELGLDEGDELEYYIRVWDNDGVSGPKASTSATFKVVYPTLDAKYDEIGEKQDDVKEELESLKRRSEKLKEEYKKFQRELLDKKQLSFDDKKQLQQMIEEHNQMMKEVEEAQKKFEETKEELQENQMISEQTLEKYDQLNEFMEKMKDSKLEEMLKEMQEKMEELDPETVKEQLEQLEMKDEDIQKSLERTLELLKQLEVQQKIDEVRNKLDKLAAKQENLNEKTENTDPKDSESLEKIAEQQEELEKQLDQIQKDLEELGEMKKETETPDQEKMEDIEKMGDEAKEEMKEASEKMDEASEQSEQGKKKQSKSSKSGASQKQKSAQQKMKQMSESLSSMQMEMQMQQDQQNLENLRELLENLLKLSFDQEDLRDDVKALKYGDPALKDRGQNQKKLEDDMELVQDSLESLANKVFQIQQFVMDETKVIEENMKKSQIFFRNKQIPMITYHQQTAMTSINNLANMLSDVMKQIQSQMKSSMAGQGMCPKPGSSGQDMQQLIQQQKGLNQQMQQMMNGGQVDPNALAKMAAQQEAIRKALKDAHEKLQQEGKNALGDMGKVMKDMEDTEAELLNKMLTKETIKRQKDILTRLLYSEKSIRERDLDDKRESKIGQVDDRKSPEELSIEEYKNKLRQELLKSNQLEYSNDFIKLIEEYYKKLEGTNE